MNVWSRLTGDPTTKIKKLGSGTTREEVPGSDRAGRRDNSVYPLTLLIMNVPAGRFRPFETVGDTV